MREIYLCRRRRPRGHPDAGGAGSRAGPRKSPDRGRGRGRQPPRLHPARRSLSASAWRERHSRPGDRRPHRSAGRRRRGLRHRRRGLRPGRFGRLCRILRRRREPLPAQAQALEPDRGGGNSGNLFHRLRQCFYPRRAESGRDVPRPRRLQRHRLHRHPAGEEFWRARLHDGWLGGKMRFLHKPAPTPRSIIASRISSRK